MSFYVIPQEDLERVSVAECKDLRSAEKDVRQREGIFTIVKVMRYANTQVVPATARTYFRNPNARAPKDIRDVKAMKPE